MAKRYVHWEQTTGEPVVSGNATVTPISKALVLRLPVGVFVWNRPSAVLVDNGRTTERIPVRDVTRMAQWGLLGAALGFAALSWTLGRNRTKGTEEN